MTILDIANLALTQVGSEMRLTSLNDKTKAGRLCSQHIDASRRSALTLHPWKFATGRVTLAPLANSFATVTANGTTTPLPPGTLPPFGFSYAYAIPADCLQVRLVNDSGLVDGHDSTWRTEANMILCNYPVINLRYTVDVKDASQFHPLFGDVVAIHLAKKIAYSLTQSDNRNETLSKELEITLRKARHIDSTQNSPEHLIADYFDNVRIGPNRGYVRDPQT